jgi:hypothetical protein
LQQIERLPHRGRAGGNYSAGASAPVWEPLRLLGAYRNRASGFQPAQSVRARL